jgi:hypothetical protein
MERKHLPNQTKSIPAPLMSALAKTHNALALGRQPNKHIGAIGADRTIYSTAMCSPALLNCQVFGSGMLVSGRQRC